MHRPQFSLSFCAVLIAIGSIAYNPINAATKRKVPNGCRQVGVDFNNNLVLFKPVNKEKLQSEEPQTVYLIHNGSPEYSVTMKVEKLDSEPFSPTYKNTIKSTRWAALAVDQQLIQFSCSTAHGESINCGNVLEICQYNNAKFASHNMGTYWIVKNGSRRVAIQGSIRSGILLRW